MSDLLLWTLTQEHTGVGQVLHTSALHGHWMKSWGPARSDWQWGWMVTESMSSALLDDDDDLFYSSSLNARLLLFEVEATVLHYLKPHFGQLFILCWYQFLFFEAKYFFVHYCTKICALRSRRAYSDTPNIFLKK